MTRPLALLLAAALAGAAQADPPEILSAVADRQGDGWRVSVTLRHPDTGWEHYADGWRIETGDGTVLGTRVLVHPHEQEQPFTRALSGVALPEAVPLFVRARCLVDGWGTGLVPLERR